MIETSGTLLGPEGSAAPNLGSRVLTPVNATVRWDIRPYLENCTVDASIFAGL